MKISVCIPTCNRPEFLKQAVESCLDQTLVPFEVLIGDDSDPITADSHKVVEELSKATTVKIRYYHNEPSLKQALNVNRLLFLAEGEYLVLLHDDDLLLPQALEKLSSCIDSRNNMDIVFGKQYIVSENGIIDYEASEKVNYVFYRSSKYEGSILSSLEAGFLQQFPNDGYLIKSEIARQIKYDETTGDACDFDFGLRVGIGGYKIHFLNEYTGKYRVSNEAISNNFNNNAGLISFDIVEKLDVPENSLPYKSLWLKNKAPIALVQAVNSNNRKRAFNIFFSTWHRDKIFSLGGIKRFLFLVFSIKS